MKNIKLTYLLISTLFYAAAAGSALYKGLDEDGNTVYSDAPFNNQAKPFTPPALSIVDAKKTKPVKELTTKEETVGFKYTAFDIASPKDNVTLWNEPDLKISLNLKPGLNTAEDHRIWLLVDGKVVAKNSQSLTLSLSRLNRGGHQLQAQVRDKQGNIIVRTRTIVIFIKYPSNP